MKFTTNYSRLVITHIWLAGLLTCANRMQAETGSMDYLAFPPQRVADPALLPDAPSYAKLRLHYNGGLGLAIWNGNYRLLNETGNPVTTKRGMPWAVASEPTLYESGWIMARTREEPHADPGGTSAVYVTYLPEVVGIDSAGNRGSVISIDSVSGGTIGGVRTPARYTATTVAGQDGWALAAWGSEITPTGVANALPVTMAFGRWMRPGEPIGARIPLLPGGYHARVITAEGAWLVIGQTLDHRATTGRWLAAGAVATEPTFVIPSSTAAITSSGVDLYAEPIQGGAVVARLSYNAITGAHVINHYFVSRAGTVGPPLVLGRPPVANIESYSLCEQSDGSLRAFWIEVVGIDKHWRTAMIQHGSGDTLIATPSTEGEPVGYFQANQSFAAGIGPQGPVTLSTDNPSTGSGFVWSQHGIPAYPMGDPVKISGTESIPLEPKVAATDDGYVAAWLENRSIALQVWLMRYDSEGRPLWTEPVNATHLATIPTGATLATPAVAFGGGEICVGWMERGPIDAIYVQRISLTGQHLGTPLWVDSHATEDLRALRLAYVDGRFITAFRERPRGGGASVILNSWVTATSGREGGIFGAGGEFAVSPEMASRGADALLIGRQTSTILQGAIMKASGITRLSRPIKSTLSDLVVSPAVAWSPAADAYLVAWINARSTLPLPQIEACRISATGTFLEGTHFVIAEIPTGTNPTTITVAATAQGWWVGVNLASSLAALDDPGLMAVLVSANGSVTAPRSLETMEDNRMFGENLTAVAGPNGGILIGGERAFPVTASLRLIFPTEMIPQLTMNQTPQGIHFTWPTSAHFPAQPNVMECSPDLKTWTPLSVPPQLSPATPGLATLTVTPADARCFFRLQAK